MRSLATFLLLTLLSWIVHSNILPSGTVLVLQEEALVESFGALLAKAKPLILASHIPDPPEINYGVLVRLAFSNIKLLELDWGKSHAEFTHYGVNVSMVDVKTRLTADYQIRLAGKGQLEVNATAKMDLATGLYSDDKGHLTIRHNKSEADSHTLDCNIDLQLELKLHGSKIANGVAQAMKGWLQGFLSKLVCGQVKDKMAPLAIRLLEKFPTTTSIRLPGLKNLDVDFSIKQDPVKRSGMVIASVNGSGFDNDGHKYPNLTVPFEWHPSMFFKRKDVMAQLYISKYTLDSMMQVLFGIGFLDFTIPPSKFPSLLDASPCAIFGAVAPGVCSFPRHLKTLIRIRVTDNPRVDFHDYPSVVAKAMIDVSATPSDDSPDKTYLFGTTADMTIGIKPLQQTYSSTSLNFSVLLEHNNLQMAKTHAGEVDIEGLTTLISVLLRVVMLPYVETLIAVKFPLVYDLADGLQLHITGGRIVAKAAVPNGYFDLGVEFRVKQNGTIVGGRTQQEKTLQHIMSRIIN